MSKKCNLALIMMAGAVLSSGCSSMNNTERGALGGGAFGAAVGALADSKHPGTGAAIGALAGGTIGGLAGNAADQDERRIKQAQAYAAQPVQGPLNLQDIVDMVRRGLSDDVVRNQIRASGTRYNLAPTDVSWLHDNGVSDAVIKEMQNTMYRRGGPRAVYVDQGYDPVVVVPPPRPVYGPSFGFGYYRYR